MQFWEKIDAHTHKPPVSSEITIYIKSTIKQSNNTHHLYRNSFSHS